MNTETRTQAPVARMYDGTRTVAACWKLALDTVEEME